MPNESIRKQNNGSNCFGKTIKSFIQFSLTCDNAACDGGSLLLAIDDRLNTEGVLNSRS